MSATAEIGRIVRVVLAPLLAEWQRRRHCFFRAIGDGTQTISLQTVGAPSAVRAQFVINVGVHFPELAAIRSFPFDPLADCDMVHASIRLASLGGRTSYCVRPEDDGMRAIVRQDVCDHALPYLDHARTREGLLAVRGSSPLDCIALLLALGRNDDARALYQEHLLGRDDVAAFAQARYAVDLRPIGPA